MATMVGLLKTTDEIVNETYERRNEADAARDVEYTSVVKVQAWFRGNRSRAYLGFLNQCATRVQKRWRGYLGRRYYREKVKMAVFVMKLNFYNLQATKIQKIWRGFYTRKYIFNYYSRKRYLEGLVIKNEIVRQDLQDYADQQQQVRRWQREEAAKAQLDSLAASQHHLVSTTVIPGVYNSPYQAFPSEMEFFLRASRPPTPRKRQRGVIFDPTPKRYDVPRPCPLPPIQSKPQGPFCDPRKVQHQRYKPFQPTLRVATSYTSVEEARRAMKQQEWVERLHDNTFVPFSRHETSYKPLLHTTSNYGHLPYGAKYFREEFVDRHIAQSFQSVVPPIPILEKLNDTYSQGQV